jgi:hypothetical protein
VIRISQITSELLKECPEFQQTWDEYLRWMEKAGNPRTSDTDAFMIAMFLNQSYKSQQTHFFPRFFAFSERLLTDGEPETQTAVDQILKQMRMSLVTRMNGPELYASWMGVETKRHWEKVCKEIVANYPERASKPRRRIRPDRLREYKVTLTKCRPEERAVPLDYQKTMEAGTATKLGGDPYWLQSDERPKCPCCNQPMIFVAQIDSIEHMGSNVPSGLNAQNRSALRKDQQWMFGDVGMIYVFFCFDCMETRSVFQCH